MVPTIRVRVPIPVPIIPNGDWSLTIQVSTRLRLLTVRQTGFQSVNTGSTPVGVTKVTVSVRSWSVTQHYNSCEQRGKAGSNLAATTKNASSLLNVVSVVMSENSSVTIEASSLKKGDCVDRDPNGQKSVVCDVIVLRSDGETQIKVIWESTREDVQANLHWTMYGSGDQVKVVRKIRETNPDGSVAETFESRREGNSVRARVLRYKDSLWDNSESTKIMMFIMDSTPEERERIQEQYRDLNEILTALDKDPESEELGLKAIAGYDRIAAWWKGVKKS